MSNVDKKKSFSVDNSLQVLNDFQIQFSCGSWCFVLVDFFWRRMKFFTFVEHVEPNFLGSKNWECFSVEIFQCSFASQIITVHSSNRNVEACTQNAYIKCFMWHEMCKRLTFTCTLTTDRHWYSMIFLLAFYFIALIVDHHRQQSEKNATRDKHVHNCDMTTKKKHYHRPALSHVTFEYNPHE